MVKLFYHNRIVEECSSSILKVEDTKSTCSLKEAMGTEINEGFGNRYVHNRSVDKLKYENYTGQSKRLKGI